MPMIINTKGRYFMLFIKYSLFVRHVFTLSLKNIPLNWSLLKVRLVGSFFYTDLNSDENKDDELNVLKQADFKSFSQYRKEALLYYLFLVKHHTLKEYSNSDASSIKLFLLLTNLIISIFW